MAEFMLVCKSYGPDLRRVQRLMDSLAPHNPERIPVAIVVPEADLPAFRAALAGHDCTFASDEEVVRSHPQAAEKNLLARYAATPGYRSQQVIKSEAWRLLGCDAYLCMDSDTVFLRDIARRDFLHPDGHPYTLLHQGRELLQLALDRGHPKVLEHFLAESAKLKALFGRDGPDHDFGPQPLLWSAHVWHDLHERFLVPRGWTLWDAIDAAPTEIRWYGEALLAFRSIPIDAIEPLFRVYHYDWQWLAMRRLGETPERVARLYLGACYQSNWEYELDGAGARSFGSRLARRLQRWRRRLQALR